MIKVKVGRKICCLPIRGIEGGFISGVIINRAYYRVSPCKNFFFWEVFEMVNNCKRNSNI